MCRKMTLSRNLRLPWMWELAPELLLSLDAPHQMWSSSPSLCPASTQVSNICLKSYVRKSKCCLQLAWQPRSGARERFTSCTAYDLGTIFTAPPETAVPFT